jgi:hypothetical protein
VVALAEKRIGEELARGRAEGTILKAHEQTRRKPERGSAGHHAPPATIAELGLKKHHNRDCVQMAAVPAEVIHETVETANAEGRLFARGGDRKGPIKVGVSTLILRWGLPHARGREPGKSGVRRNQTAIPARGAAASFRAARSPVERVAGSGVRVVLQPGC